MSQPPPYTPQHSFVSDSATLANFPGQALDVEFQSVKTTTDAIETNLALIQRDDGVLANASVGFDQLSPALQTSGIAPANAWATGITYTVGTGVVQSGTLYRCSVQHTSGVFATDLAAGKWILVAVLTAAFVPGANLTLTGNTFSVSVSPSFTTPNIGIATATSINGVAVTPAAGATLAIAAGKTATISSTMTLVGSDGISLGLGGGGTVAYKEGSLVQFAATTSADLASILTNETGSGSVVFSTSPTLVTPTLGAATATSINKVTITGPATGSTLTILDGKTATINNSITFAGTDGTVQTFPSTSGTVVTSVSVNAVTNAMSAQMPAYTIRGNATGSTANVTDIDVTALTLKASPVTGDIVLIQDSAASNAFKKTTVGALASAGSVASIAGNTGAFTLGAGITNAVNVLKATVGAVIASSLTTYATQASLPTLVPADDTIPTNTEGDQIISVSFTPQISTSKLRCTFRGTVSNGSADNVVASIFQGSTNIGSQMVNITGANLKAGMHIVAEYSPGTTSAQTISVRAGGVATAITFNGTIGGGRLLGGAQAATLLIEEINA